MTGTAQLHRDGLWIRARTWGPEDGPFIVLQHGRGADATGWTAVAEHLAAGGHRVLAPDLRGHGESDWDPQRRYSVAVLADDLAEWITASADGPCVLVGHSYGAAVALATAGRHPALVRSLLLEDGGPAGRRLVSRWGRAAPPVPRTRLDSAADAEAEMELVWPGDTTPENRDRRLAHFFRAEADGSMRWRSDIPGMSAAPRDHLLLEGSWDLLTDLRCPLTLVVAGTDSMLDPDVEKRVRAAVPSARVVVVPGAGHDVHNSSPDAYLRLLDELVASALPEVSP